MSAIRYPIPENSGGSSRNIFKGLRFLAGARQNPRQADYGVQPDAKVPPRGFCCEFR